MIEKQINIYTTLSKELADEATFSVASEKDLYAHSATTDILHLDFTLYI